MFTTAVGTPIDGPACTHRFQACLKKAKLTMNVYSHVIPAMQREVASQIGAILKPVAPSAPLSRGKAI